MLRVCIDIYIYRPRSAQIDTYAVQTLSTGTPLPQQLNDNKPQQPRNKRSNYFSRRGEDD